ncbi:MAG: fatty acid desaturase [Planctomycetota bacterium]
MTDLACTAAAPVKADARSTARGVGLFAVDAALYACLFALATTAEDAMIRAALSVGLGFAVSFLFLVGHDACHNALTPSTRLNRILGTLAFLPSYHPFSLWRLGHNQTHHGFTNLKGKDYVFAPLSPTEYAALPRSRQWEYRFYRSLAGIPLYFLVEIWWKRMLAYELTVEADRRRPEYRKDRAIVLAFAAAQVAVLALVGRPSGVTELALDVAVVVVIPFLIWKALASFLIWLHHTHPQVRWYDDPARWSKETDQTRSTVHVVFPGPINLVLHRIMEHTAHHQSPATPCYALRDAQEEIEQQRGADVTIEHWTLRRFLRGVRACKLYDFEADRWVDFDGTPAVQAALSPGSTASRPSACTSATSSACRRST